MVKYDTPVSTLFKGFSYYLIGFSQNLTRILTNFLRIRYQLLQFTALNYLVLLGNGFQPISLDWFQTTLNTQVKKVYDVIFTRTTKQCPCPFPGCLGSSRTWNDLRSHFNRQHWGDRIRILK